MTSSQPLVSFQPFKAIYTLYTASSVFVRLPVWIIYYYSPSRRPRRSWTLRKCLMNEALRLYFDYSTNVRTQSVRSFTPDKEGDRFTLIKPVDESFYAGSNGELLKSPDVRPAAVPAIWYPRAFNPQSQDASRRVILHLHPGAYVVGSERAWAAPAQVIAAETDALILMIGYRFSSATPFPAQLQDLITAYFYLINDLHVKPKNTVISGDSAGGHCALNLLRYIEEGAFPKPSSMLLCSPMTTMVSNKDAINRHRNHASDYIEWGFLNWGIETYTRDRLSRTHPYASPALHPFKTTVPLWVCAGEAEVMVDEIVAFADAMKEAGNRVELQTAADQTHDPLWVAFMNGFASEGAELAKSVGRFVKDHAG